MGRQIKVTILARDEFVKAYIKDRLRDDPNLSFCDTPSPDADVFIVEQPLLTQTEQKILQAIAELGSIEAVAEKLLYHRSTVKRKLCRIYGKLRVKSAPQAVAVAMRLGLIK